MIHNIEHQIWGNNTTGVFVYDGENSHRLPESFIIVQPRVNPEMQHLLRRYTTHSRNLQYQRQSSRAPQGSAQNFPLMVEGF